MPLHPDLAGFLELVEFGRLTGKSHPMHSLPVAEARLEFERASAILDASPPEAVAVQALRIASRDGQSIPGRLYRRPGSESRVLPVLLYLHGGGYVVGSLDSHDSVCRRLALAGDFAVLAPDYRLAPEYPFPTAVEDCLDSANWLLEHAAKLNLDATRVAVGGDSVGASLATVLAISAVHAPQTMALRPRAQLLFYPVTDISTQRDSHQRYAEGYLLETATLEWFYAHYAADASNDWRVSPLLFQGLQPLADALVSLAEFDPLFDEGQAWAEQLQGSGTAVTVQVQAGLTHDFLRMHGMVAEVEGIYQQIGQWLDQRF
ncbi:alpha/beta hydrolase [Pseudomonas alkylphenolica]|uniref:alpha/beta hydrolase n=1 Tax=Pseudomonas alkylphenolica TaxID=237609 RepID=UPI00315CA7D5